MATAFPSIVPSQTSQKSVKRNMLTASYGGGYEQRMPNGINYIRDAWSITWSGLNTTDKNTIVTFLTTVSDGSTISWTTPFDSVSKKFVLDGEYTIADSGGLIHTITCTLRQVYDLT